LENTELSLLYIRDIGYAQLHCNVSSGDTSHGKTVGGAWRNTLAIQINGMSY